MTRILFYADVHAKDQNPRSRTGSYRADILLKLCEIIGMANDLKVDYLINGADTFDQKSSWRTSHDLVTEMIRIFANFPGDRHLTTIGTHDVPTGRLDKLHQQPLGVLAEAGAITVHYDPEEIVSFDTIDFHFVPASYALDKDPKNYSSPPRPPNTKKLITVAHGMILPPGQGFFGDFTSSELIETEADYILYGHPHTPDGIYKARPNGPTFVGPGSVARLGSYPYNLDRKPQVAVIDILPGEPDHIALRELTTARDPKDVFADAIKEDVDENQMQERIGAFVESLRSASIADDRWGEADLLAELNSLDAPLEVRELAKDILLSVT